MIAPLDPKTIQEETADFLEGVPTSKYSPVSGYSVRGLLKTAEGTASARSSTPVTMVRGPYLPMYFSIANANNSPLKFALLVNPTNVNHGKTSSVYPAYTRSGYVTQLWGPNQDLISATGSSAAFMVEGEGLTNVLMRQSLGFQNLLALIAAYRNNGYQFFDPIALKQTVTRVINVIHGVEMSYDDQIFMGHFNNFTLEQSADKPFVMNYNFDFVVSSLFNDYNEVRGHFIPINADNPIYGPMPDRKTRQNPVVPAKPDTKVGENPPVVNKKPTPRTISEIKENQDTIKTVVAPRPAPVPSWNLDGAWKTVKEPETVPWLLRPIRIGK